MPQEIPPRPFQPGPTLLWTDLSVTLLIDQVRGLLRDEFHNPTFVRHHWLDMMASAQFFWDQWTPTTTGGASDTGWHLMQFARAAFANYPNVRESWGHAHNPTPSDVADRLIRWFFPPEPDRTFIYYGYHLAGPKLTVSFCRRDQIPAHFLTSD